jgi:hypothetical protein
MDCYKRPVAERYCADVADKDPAGGMKAPGNLNG